MDSVAPQDFVGSPDSVGKDARLRAARLRKRFLVALPLGACIMALSMAPAVQFPGWQWLCGALAIPVVTWCAWPFHRAAFTAARHGSTTMDTLVSMGVIVSAAWSYWALLFGGAGHIGMKMSMSLLPRAHTGSAELYFEAATMIVVFLLGGRWAEARTRYRAGDALRALLDLGAKEATLIRTDPSGSETETVIPAADLEVSDLFLVRPGEKIATDGVIVRGSSALDTSLLTGESQPVDVSEGQDVTGGTLNTWGVLVVRATRVGRDTTLAQIGRMVADAQSTKAPVQALADRVSAVFVPVIIALSVATLIGWYLVGHSFQSALEPAVAVLVVACPCALGLATPTALLVGSGRASQLGILIRNASVLEQTRTVDTAVLDKTGTVTTGVLSVEEIQAADADSDFLLAVAASAEAGSEHPLGRAIVKAAASAGLTIPAASAFTNHAGRGVSALIASAGDSAADSRSDSGADSDFAALVGRGPWFEDHGVAIPSDLGATAQRLEATGATVVFVATCPPESIGIEPAVANASLAALVSPDDEGSVRVTLEVGGMTCASCVGRVERKLKKLPGVRAQVNLATETAAVTLSEDHSDSELESVIEAAGYRARVVSRETISHETAEVETVRGLPAVVAGAKVLGLAALRDTIKEDSAMAVAQMRSMGIEPVLLTGDNVGAASHVGAAVGIERILAGVTPQQKRDEVARLQEEGRVVAMVGDGVNDAAAMAQAAKRGFAMAMGSGTDVAMAVADITAVNSDLESVPRAVRISRATLRTIKGNLFWAFFYNVAAVPLAMFGLLNPMIAAGAMAFSSVFVVLNSLRLRSAG